MGRLRRLWTLSQEDHVAGENGTSCPHLEYSNLTGLSLLFTPFRPPFTPLTLLLNLLTAPQWWTGNNRREATTTGPQHLQDRGTNHWLRGTKGRGHLPLHIPRTSSKGPFHRTIDPGLSARLPLGRSVKAGLGAPLMRAPTAPGQSHARPASFFFTQSAGKYRSASESKASARVTTAKRSQTQQHHRKSILSCPIFLCFIAPVAYLYFAFTVFRLAKTLLGNKPIQMTFISH